MRVGVVVVLVVQAQEAGAKLREMVGPTGKAYFYVSPYVRTLQTALEMGKCLDRSQACNNLHYQYKLHTVRKCPDNQVEPRRWPGSPRARSCGSGHDNHSQANHKASKTFGT